MGGHIVSGHVDGVGRLSSIRRTGEDYVLRVSCPKALMREVVVKGSVALEGISLTVTATGEDWFEVHIIPTTWHETSLKGAQTGETVNIETDIIAKYVRKYTGSDVEGESVLERMKRAGFS
jgi:riboflavin synthase